MNKIDKKDMKILANLFVNSRQSDSSIAKKVRLSKQVVNYRIKNLIDKGIIKTFRTIINLSRLGIKYHSVIYLKLKTKKDRHEKHVLDNLINNKKIGYIALVGGEYDLFFIIGGKDIISTNEVFKQVLNDIDDEVEDYYISPRLNSHQFLPYYLKDIKVKKEKHKEYAGKKSIVHLDQLDKDILRLLATNSRLGLVELNKELEIPLRTIAFRIKRMQKQGVIAGYSVLDDPDKLDVHRYKLLIDFRNLSEHEEKKLIRFCKQHDNINSISFTIGKWNITTRVEFRKMIELQDLIQKMRHEFPGMIKEIKPLMLFKELKEDFGVALDLI